VHHHLHGHLKALRIDEQAAIEAMHDGGFDPSNETAIRFIAARDWHFTVCRFGRVHTNITNLKSELRKHLSVNGEGLVNLDIRNSQPLVFAALLKEHFGESGRVPADVRHFMDLCQAGTFYDYLMGESGIPSDQRSAFKRSFFGRVFFIWNDPPTKEALAFGAVFPNVYRVIREMKADKYEALAQQLQRKESSIMIGGVASRCMREIPQAFVGTIHDSILCHPRYTDIIRRFILQEFAKVDLIPTIRIESP
jgi:hypothetical protein